MQNIKVVILAAGRSKRMNNSEIPKVLINLKGKPLIQYLLEVVKKSDLDKRPVIVVGRQAELIKKKFGSNYDYVYQEKLLGTGHAVLQTKDLLENKVENIMVLYGDHPFLTYQSINKLADIHLNKKHFITLMTAGVPHFNDWYQFFYDFGRIVRDENGQIKEIIEKRDASPEQLQIKEVNPAYFCFKADWLWENLAKLKNNNAQGEYYLTDLVKIAIEQGLRIDSIDIDPKEAMGINTPEQLQNAEKIIGDNNLKGLAY
jgi:bifunctional UDP-N-acetylglucosamine pyrophosphorylase/glucosamine-1-phosphate N-acetyltransferase